MRIVISKNNYLIFLFFILLSLIFAVASFFIPSQESFNIIVVLANFIFILALIIMIKNNDRPISESLSALMIIIFYSTHFLYQTAFLFNIVEYDSYVIYNQPLFYRATILSLAGFCAILSGIFLAGNEKKEQKGNIENIQSARRICKVATFMAFLFFIIFLFEVFRIGITNFKELSYNSPELNDKISKIMDHVQNFFMYSIIVSFASLSLQRWRKEILLPASMSFVFVFLLILWGYRGHILFFLLACYMVFSVRIKPLKRRTLFILLLLIILTWPIILTSRQVAIKDRDYKEIFIDSTAEKNILDTFIRTPGQMITTVTRAIDLYPNAFPFLFGRTYLQAIYYILPNFFGEKRNETLLSFSQEMSRYYFGGIVMEGGGSKGVGSTFLAEAYGNFGVFGLILLILTGYIARRAEISLAKKFNPGKLAMYGELSFLLLWTMRNDSRSLFRGVLYAYIMILFIKYVARKYTLKIKT